MISNVPGSRVPLYWRGARLDGNYPFSIALDGQALNITMANNGDNLDFGLVGARGACRICSGCWATSRIR